MKIGHNSAPEWQRNPGNWIAVSRDIRDHPLVGFCQPVTPADPKRGSASRNEAWMDLLFMAAYRPREETARGGVVLLNVGQLVGARRWLAERWNWSEKTVRWFLDRLIDDGMLLSQPAELRRQQVPENRGPQRGPDQGPQQGPLGDVAKGPLSTRGRQVPSSVLTVCNYSKYQLLSSVIEEYVESVKGPLEDAAKGPQKGPEQGPQRGQSNNNRTNKQSSDGGAPDGATPTASKATRLPRDWTLKEELRVYTLDRYEITDNEVARQAERFRDYWVSQPAHKAYRTDWVATWRNWIGNHFALRHAPPPPKDELAWLHEDPRKVASLPVPRWAPIFEKHLKVTDRKWNPKLGPPPGQPKCALPDHVISAYRLTQLYTKFGDRTAEPLPWVPAEQGRLLG